MMQVTVITQDNEVVGVFAKPELAATYLYKHGYETEEAWLEGGFEVSIVTVEGL
jgi:hypothetical protein